MPQGLQAICYSIIIVSNGKGITKVPSLTKLNLTFPQLFLMPQCHQWGNNRLISQETVEKRTQSVKENINFNTLTRCNLFKGCKTFHLKANIATKVQYCNYRVSTPLQSTMSRPPGSGNLRSATLNMKEQCMRCQPMGSPSSAT